METANIINLYTIADKQQWIRNKNNVYIGRGTKDLPASKWGNPHKLRGTNNRPKVVQQYSEYFSQNKELVNSVIQLKGKTLGCWCSPEQCHGEILHKAAGNQPVYQSLKNSDMDTKILDKQVTDSLQAMSDIMEAVGQDQDTFSTPEVNEISTPKTQTQSTIETNKIYETLLESKTPSTTSFNSSLDRSSSSYVPATPKLHEKLSSKERFDLECKLQDLGSKFNRSLQFSSCPSLSRHTIPERKTVSAPTSPTKDSPTMLNPPNSFSYNTSRASVAPILNELGDLKSSDATTKILEFLAQKIDLLAVNVNTIQFNLHRLCESFRISIDDKVAESIDDKFSYLENKLEFCKINFNIELEALREENTQLRSKLDSYILEESERSDRIVECFNTPPNVPNCIVDLQPLKEELESKLFDLDVRLIECEQYSRRESLVISGIPETFTQKQLQNKVIDILSCIGLVIIPDDISACHRLHKAPGSAYPAKVIVRFCNRKVVNFCLEHKDDLQQKAFERLRLNLRFFESLCSKNEETLRISNWLSREKKIHSHFLRNGFVKILKSENDRPRKIKHPDILRQMFDVPAVI